MILPDLLAPDLRLVLCGSAPSRASKEAGAYYAHPGNLFWKTLFEVGLTPRLLAPAEFRELLDFGIGLTDINKTEWGADSDLSKDGMDVGAFLAKMDHFRPQAIGLTSKFVGGLILGRKKLGYGLQPETFFGAVVFVLPSPSGRARGFFDIGPWRALGRAANLPLP